MRDYYDGLMPVASSHRSNMSDAESREQLAREPQLFPAHGGWEQRWNNGDVAQVDLAVASHIHAIEAERVDDEATRVGENAGKWTRVREDEIGQSRSPGRDGRCPDFAPFYSL